MTFDRAITRHRTLMPTLAILTYLAIATITSPTTHKAYADDPQTTTQPTATSPATAPTSPTDQQPEPTPSPAPTPKPTRAKLDTPRATMTTFLNAIDEALHGKVERYPDAVQCLDLSGLSELPDDARAARGRKLAAALNTFIENNGLEIELIPDTPTGQPYVFHQDQDGRPAVLIERNTDGQWLFTWQSLAYIENPPTPKPDAPTATEPAPAPTPKPAEKPAAKPDTSVPAEYRTARSTMRTFRDAMATGRTADAANCLDLTEIPSVARAEKGMELAVYLHESIKRTKEVVLQQVPDDPAAEPYIFRQDQLGIIVIAPMTGDSEQAGRWLFTKETVAQLESLYDELLAAGEDTKGEETASATPFSVSLWLRTNMPDYLRGKWVLLMHWQWLCLVIVFAVGRLARAFTVALMKLIWRTWLRHRGITGDEKAQTSTFKPVGILAASAIWWIGLTWLSLDAQVLAVLLAAVKFIACWATVWTFYHAVDLVCDYFMKIASKTRTQIDDLLVPLGRKTAKTLVTVLGLYFIIRQFTDSRPLELLAGLGLGGLAIALAAQDTLKNLFGSVTVILDRPFKVGDWVVIGDVEGTVESLGFRSTRIRTFYNSQVVVPNSSLISATVDNLGARRYRRYKTMISVVYSTPADTIAEFCEGIRGIIRTHPYTRKDYFHVYTNAFAPSSIDILLYCFFETPDWGMELAERERLILDIMRLAERMGVEFAFPTTTVHIAPNDDQAPTEPRAIQTSPPEEDNQP